MVSLLHLLSYVASITAFLFVTLSLASGLLWLAELIEERSRYARVVGVRAIYTIIVIHALLYVTDGLPFLSIVFSIFCHLVYLQHFSSATWPFISLTSPVFLLSCVLVVADHFLWFFHFAAVAQETRRLRSARYRYQHNAATNGPSFMDVAAFFAICVWLIPLFLFLSLSANDNVIPSFDTSAPSSPMGSTVDLTAGSQDSPTRRRLMASSSLVKSILTPIVNLIPRGRRSNGGGIIAPPTPGNASPIQMQGYSPWGESSPTTPTSYAKKSLASDPMASHGSTSGRSFTPPPLRRAPSEPPKGPAPSFSADDRPSLPRSNSSLHEVGRERSPSRSRSNGLAVDTGTSYKKAD